MVTAAFFGRERRAAAARGGCVWILDREPTASHRIYEVDFGALEVSDADRVDEQANAVRFEYLVALPSVLFDHQAVLESGTPSALHEHAQTAVLLLLFGEKLGDFGGCRGRNVNHVVHSLRGNDDPAIEIIQYNYRGVQRRENEKKDVIVGQLICEKHKKLFEKFSRHFRLSYFLEQHR